MKKGKKCENNGIKCVIGKRQDDGKMIYIHFEGLAFVAREGLDNLYICSCDSVQAFLSCTRFRNQGYEGIDITTLNLD